MGPLVLDDITLDVLTLYVHVTNFYVTNRLILGGVLFVETSAFFLYYTYKVQTLKETTPDVVLDRRHN